MRSAAACILLSAYCIASAMQAGAQQPSPPAVLIKAGRVISVRDGKVLTDQAILTDGERIKEVGPVAAVTAHAPQGTRVIDLGDATLLPGLIDCHTHLTMEAGRFGVDRFNQPIPRQALTGAKNAKITLEAGFTTVRNVGASGYADIALRDAINAGDIPGPRICASGPSLGPTGGHSDNNLLAPEYHAQSDGVANGVPGVIQKTREVVKYGADCIKVMATGGVLSKGDSVGAEQYSDEEMRAIITEAHRMGRKVAAHAHGASGMKQAIRAGVDSIEHGSYIDDEVIRLMREHRTYLVPTLYLKDWIAENPSLAGLPSYSVEKMAQITAVANNNIEKAFRAGVKVAFGTDAAVYPHGLNAREFSVMVRLGLTPMQAIQAATVNAAELLGWSDRAGSLEAGRYADIIAVNGDPIKDVAVLEKVAFVMKGGRVVKDNLSEH